ncbi:MAG: hypothetical protein ACT4PE_08725 [Candidatus Eiseniibacteriota bacterium]
MGAGVELGLSRCAQSVRLGILGVVPPHFLDRSLSVDSEGDPPQVADNTMPSNKEVPVHSRLHTVLAATAVVTLWPHAAVSVDWNVNPAGTGDAATIQEAYDLASPGDRIVLAPGTYQDNNTRLIQAYNPAPNTTSAVAHMSSGVSISSVGGAGLTFVDGEGLRHGLVGADLGNVEISGISFINGRTNGNGGGTEIWGGGVLTYRSSVVIQDNRFVDCVATKGGGGGGALIQGAPNAIVTRNLCLRGSAGDLGGGLEVFETASASVTNNTFVDNYAVRSGGAMMINNTVIVLNNNIFASNTAGTGGALGCLNSHTVTSQCNLFWSNSGPEISACGVAIGVHGNLSADPQFCNPSTDFYAIQAGSPAEPGHPSGCGLLRANGVGCGPVPVAVRSWGSIKGAYR